MGVDCVLESFPGELPEEWNKEDLQRIFEKFGDVGDVFIPRDRDTGKNRPFCFVRYYKEDDAEEAIKEMDGSKVGSSKLTVIKATKSRDEAFAKSSEHNKGYGRGGRSRSRGD